MKILIPILILISLMVNVGSFAQEKSQYINTAIIDYPKADYIQNIRTRFPDPKVSNIGILNDTDNSWTTFYTETSNTKEDLITEILENNLDLTRLKDYNNRQSHELLALNNNTEKIIYIKLLSKKTNALNITVSGSNALKAISKVTLYNEENNSILTNTYNDNIITDQFINLSFPDQSLSSLKVVLQINQNLNIENITSYSAESVDISYFNFLAKPNDNYTLFINGDRTNVEYSGILSDAKTVEGKLSNLFTNEFYQGSDTDSDSIPDRKDNCQNLPNKDQLDKDNNNVGDACQDNDGDDIMDSVDNCPLDRNQDQSDIDRDGVGDVCDKSDNRFLEGKKWVLWTGLGLVAILLPVATYFTLKKKE